MVGRDLGVEYLQIRLTSGHPPPPARDGVLFRDIQWCRFRVLGSSCAFCFVCSTSPAHGRITRKPSFEAVVARLKLCRLTVSCKYSKSTVQACCAVLCSLFRHEQRILALIPAIRGTRSKGGYDGRLTLSHSSHALPAPNPNPAHTGHDLRLKRRTEKITPKDAPRVLRMRRVLRQ